MKEKQPDFKKSKNDPYDLSSASSLREGAPRSDKPNPYDLSVGYAFTQDKRYKNTGRK